MERGTSDSRWAKVRDVIGAAAFVALLSGVLSGVGEQRNEFHRMRGYMEALADIERARQER